MLLESSYSAGHSSQHYMAYKSNTSSLQENIQEVGAPGKQKNRVNFMRRRRQMSCNFTDTSTRGSNLINFFNLVSTFQRS